MATFAEVVCAPKISSFAVIITGEVYLQSLSRKTKTKRKMRPRLKRKIHPPPPFPSTSSKGAKLYVGELY